jgi:hypothetical protein
MSVVTFDGAPIATEAPATLAVESGKVSRREVEFRSALDNYMAGYIAHQQKRHATATGSLASAARNSHFTLFPRFAGWIGAGADLAWHSRRASMPEIKRGIG